MIVPSTKYPAQVAVDLTNYPQGKARNVVASGDGTGTPFEKDWINDVWGFFQALVLQAGITPSGTPDTAIASQLLSAVQAVAQQRTVAAYQISASSVQNAGSPFPLSLVSQAGGFTLLGGGTVVRVPVAGRYRISFSGPAAISSAASNPTRIAATLVVGGALPMGGGCSTQRYSTVTTEDFYLHAETIVDIAAPASTDIVVNSSTFGLQFQFPGLLMIERLR